MIQKFEQTDKSAKLHSIIHFQVYLILYDRGIILFDYNFRETVKNTM